MYISEDEMYFQCDAYIYYYLFIERVDVFKITRINCYCTHRSIYCNSVFMTILSLGKRAGNYKESNE